MFRSSIGTKSEAERWLDFSLRDITGSWVSTDGAPLVRIYRTKGKGEYRLVFTYNNPQAVYSRPIREVDHIRYFCLFGRIGIAYDAERDMLLLSAYGEYRRAED